jgi:uncharacterized protein YyaL (SSP411 family)
MSENRLARETSPYLLQHRENPVHWWAWGPDAMAEAARSGKPVLLSVGYAACHWCHVMAHESFEDAATAAVMNELFVNIKVDREERPDVDAIYMGALHRLGEHGGWPMTMFLDAQGRPFWGGTYFPKETRWGKPAFVEVLRKVAEIYHQQPETVAHNAELITAMLAPAEAAVEGPAISDALLADLTQRLLGAVDRVNGGIGGAPKFPQWSLFWLLWRGGIRYDNAAARQAVAHTLTHICQGGIYDHLGGGFARYAVDERWLVPHFEKMLYDNALLLDLMTEVYRETGDPLFKTRIAETVGWLEREMIADGGAFAASLDADSEGEEGRFYVWSAEEIAEVLGPEDAEEFGRVYGVAPAGNWEGHTILNRLGSLERGDAEQETRLAAMRAKLLARRAGRVRPGWDDKVLADWNGLMIAALVNAARTFEQPAWLELAERAFDFVADEMTEGGRLRHTYRNGRRHAPATASDYANMTWAALRLYQAKLEPRYLEAARAWVGVLDRHYWLADAGGYATSADDTRDVIVRLRSAHDDATPNANAVMVSNLAALALLTGEGNYAERGEAIVHAFAGEVGRNLVAHCGLLANAMDLFAPQQVVVVGSGLPGARSLREEVRGVSLPGAVTIECVGPACDAVPAVAGKGTIDGRATAYACLGTSCSAPVTEAAALRRVLIENREAARTS